MIRTLLSSIRFYQSPVSASADYWQATPPFEELGVAVINMSYEFTIPTKNLVMWSAFQSMIMLMYKNVCTITK